MNSESSSTSELLIQQVYIRRNSQPDGKYFSYISTANILCLFHNTPKDAHTKGCAHIKNRRQSLKRVARSDWKIAGCSNRATSFFSSQPGCSNRTTDRHLVRIVAAIRRVWQEWVSNDRYQCQNGRGWFRATSGWEKREIVSAVVKASDTSLSTIHCVTPHNCIQHDPT